MKWAALEIQSLTMQPAEHNASRYFFYLRKCDLPCMQKNIFPSGSEHASYKSMKEGCGFVSK